MILPEDDGAEIPQSTFRMTTAFDFFEQVLQRSAVLSARVIVVTAGFFLLYTLVGGLLVLADSPVLATATGDIASVT